MYKLCTYVYKEKLFKPFGRAKRPSPLGSRTRSGLWYELGDADGKRTLEGAWGNTVGGDGDFAGIGGGVN